MTIPTLETDRLTLRPYRVSDFDDLFALWRNPETVRLMGMEPMTEEEAWARFQRSFGAWQVNGFGFWAVEEKAGKRYVGELGFINSRRTINPPLPVPEMGWSIMPWAKGKGYASEGVAAAIAWGEKHFGKVRFCAIIAPENAPSLKLAKKFGFVETHRTHYKGHPTIILYRD